MRQYNLLFITTFINLNKIVILLESLAYNRNLKIKIILIAQNGLQIDETKYQNDYNSITLISKSTQLSSSKARNVGIDYVLSEKIEADYVMFPDDDSSFDAAFFARFKEETKGGNPLIIDVYNENSRNRYIRHQLKPGMQLSGKHYFATGCTNMIIPYDLFVRIGCFDENMGVGARYGAGEDGDYYLRAVKYSGVFVYNPALYNFHPKADDKYKELTRKQLFSRYKKYGFGVIYMLSKHKMYFEALCVSFKALAAVPICLLKLDFKMASVYGYAFFCRIGAMMKFAKNTK